MEGLHCLGNILKKGEYMCKLDLKDACFSVPLNSASRKFIRFLWSGKLYKFLCLCFGTRPSTKNFYKNTQNCSFSVASPEHTNYNLLGRQLLIGHTIEETLMARDTVIFLLQQLGFVLNLKKSLLIPTQRIEFFGVTAHSLIMTLSLPEKKV